MKKLFILFSTVVGLFLIAWFFRFQLLEYYFKKQKTISRDAYFLNSPEEKIVKTQKKIVEDIKILSNYPIFINSVQREDDASVFLNSLVSWKLGTEIKKGSLNLPLELSEYLKSVNDINELKIDWSKWNLDFSFFNTIHQYDFWSYDQELPFIKNATSIKFEDIPEVYYFELIEWSKLRIINGRDNQNLDQAIKDITHLAKLVMSNENSVSSMAAIAILNIASKINKNPEMKDGEEIISLEHLQTAKKFFWANESFTDLRLSPESFALFSENPVGLCSRINDTLLTTIGYRQWLGVELKLNFERLTNLVKKTEKLCRQSFIRRAWEDENYRATFEYGNNPYQEIVSIFDIKSEDLIKYPQLAGAIGFFTLSLNTIDKMKDY